MQYDDSNELGKGTGQSKLINFFFFEACKRKLYYLPDYVHKHEQLTVHFSRIKP